MRACAPPWMPPRKRIPDARLRILKDRRTTCALEALTPVVIRFPLLPDS